MSYKVTALFPWIRGYGVDIHLVSNTGDTMHLMVADADDPHVVIGYLNGWAAGTGDDWQWQSRRNHGDVFPLIEVGDIQMAMFMLLNTHRDLL